MTVPSPSPSLDHELDEALLEARRSGRAAWPGVEVSAEALAAHARAVGVRAGDLASHGADLYLACAIAGGDRTATRTFERRFLPMLAGPLRRMGVPVAGIDDVLQNVSVAVLAGSPPRIAGYAARSSLFYWLRVVAVRIGVTSLRRGPGQAEGQSMIDELVDDGSNPELQAAKLQVGPELQRALEQALEKLPRRSRTILRMHYLDGLNIDAIGAVYRVHRATVARWLIAIRREVLEALRDRFALSPDATSSDFRSFYAALQGELHLSISRVLASRMSREGG